MNYAICWENVYFYEVFARDKFPKLRSEGFIIVNASPSQQKNLDGFFVSRKQKLFGRSARNTDTKLPNIVLPSAKIFLLK